MEALYFLIPIALIFCVVTLKLIFWAIQSGQYDDLDRHAHIIFEEDQSTKNDSHRDGSGNE